MGFAEFGNKDVFYHKIANESVIWIQQYI